MKRLLSGLFLLLAVNGCAGLPSVSDTPDHALCERARALARSGDMAGAEAMIDRMQDRRDAWYCRNDVLEQDRGLYPRAT